MNKKRILFIKPPDRCLENEFVYQQLGPHYLQSYLEQFGVPSDLLVLYVSDSAKSGSVDLEPSLGDLDAILVKHDGKSEIGSFDTTIFENYDVVALSVMSPQATDAYALVSYLKEKYPHLTTVIGGSHPKYYLESIKTLPDNHRFDFIVPGDGWVPMLQIATGEVSRDPGKSIILKHYFKNIKGLPAPSRPRELMEKYSFKIAGVDAFHTISALGCPYSCNFCESGREKLRNFSKEMIEQDLKMIAQTQAELGYEKKAVMFFDDVGLMNPRQVGELSDILRRNNFDTWRAFTHAYLVVKYKSELLTPFTETGGRRIGLGIETGSQKTLDLINKQNGQKQYIEDHYQAVSIANEHGIAVDAFTMIYPWEDENDLKGTTDLVKFVAQNEVRGKDELGRPLQNHVDSTIMTPYEGTVFYEMITSGKLADVRLKKDIDPGLLYYKGIYGKSGWPYAETRLPKARYEEEQQLRNSFRPEYR